MQNLLQNLKLHIITLCENPDFIHHKWYVKYHLSYVEQISFELCEIYPDADWDAVFALVWMHDYGKIISYNHQYDKYKEWEKCMNELWFDKEFSAKISHYAQKLDEKNNLADLSTPREIQIVSSADAAAHLIGPFYYLWWYENSQKDFEELMKNNLAKLQKDWNLKVCLPEIREKFQSRFEIVQEQSGIIPNTFLK